MWSILESAQARKIVPRLPNQVLEKYEFWKNVVMLQGPHALRRVPGFRDEALRGKWTGFRSSRLSLQWRVLYRTSGSNVTVTVERISPHDYR